jgi:hypothetical protein
MQDSLLKAIQQRFVQSDRFDPLHYAETEQQLFDQLTHLSDAVHKEGKASVVVEHLGRQHATNIDIKQWLAALEPYASQLKNVSIDQSIKQRHYDFNGFSPLRFAGEGRIMQAMQAINFATLEGFLLDGTNEELIYRTELPRNNQDSEKSTTLDDRQSTVDAAEKVTRKSAADAGSANAVQSNTHTATHLLQAGVAVPIDQAQIIFAANELGLSRSTSPNVQSLLESDQLFIMNDAQRQRLQINDRLGSNLADGVVLVIRVE